MWKDLDIYGKNYWFITPEKLYRCEILELDESLIFLSEFVLLMKREPIVSCIPLYFCMLETQLVDLLMTCFSYGVLYRNTCEIIHMLIGT